MRILKIELQNINSLKSDSPIVIDFESETFRDVGLYAITGSTGAGKTTIMDAVTIALYHSVPRFNKSNSKAGLEDIVSYGANEAMARVTFENKGKRYEAHWSMRLTTKTGKQLNNPIEKVRLKNLDTEKIIAEKKREVQSEIENITQLNYHQFLRSVMLAQGEFAAFLSANAKDKGTLLEQITGEEIYKKIGEAINEKIFGERSKLLQIKAKINTEDLLPDETRKELREEQRELTGKIQLLDKALKEIEKICNWYKKETELQKTEQRLEMELTLLTQEKEKKQTLLHLLHLHEQAEPFKELITEISRIEKEIEKKKQQFAELSKELETVRLKIEEAGKQEHTGSENLLKSENNLKQWLPKLEQVAKLDTDIENTLRVKAGIEKSITEVTTAIIKSKKTLEQQEQTRKKQEGLLSTTKIFLEQNKQIPEIEKQLTAWNSKLTLRKSNRERILQETHAIQKGQTELQTLNEKLGKTERYFKNENSQLDGLKKEIAERLLTLKTLDLGELLKKQHSLNEEQKMATERLALSSNYSDFVRNISTISLEIKTLEENRKTLIEQTGFLNAEIIAAEKSLTDAESILELERTLKSFEEEREKLEKEKPCPLCGSTVHPYVEKYRKIELSKPQIEVSKRKELLENLKKKEQEIALNLAEINTKSKSNSSQLKSLLEREKETLAKFNSFEPDYSIEETEAGKKAIISIDNEMHTLSEKIAETQKLQKENEKKEESLAISQKKVNKLENEIVMLTEKNKGLTQLLEQKQMEQTNLNDETEIIQSSLEKELSKFQLTIPSPENTEFFVQQMEKRILTFHNNNKELTKTEYQISQLNADIKNQHNLLIEKTSEREKQQIEADNIDKKLKELTEKRSAILPAGTGTEKKRKQLQLAIKLEKEKLEKITRYFNELRTGEATKEKEKENVFKEKLTLTDDLKKKLAALEEGIKPSVFSSRNEIEQALLNNEKKKQYHAIRKQLEDKALELKTLRTKTEEDLRNLKEEKEFEISLEIAREQQLETEKQKQHLVERTGEIRTKFDLDNQIRERNSGVFEEISQQEKILKKWMDLMTLTGGSKHAFNTYVQRLTLQNLIHLANIHLYKLNRRYSLKMNETYKPGEELNFQLIDHYQTDETRLVDTSSGGEKFLISLSLALGLSDLASNNVRIDSLFIDEGFGSLDSNTLEIVISTLETLQAQGKMIGVISHVENLKERIPTQIQVLKKRDGVSEVVIV